MYDWIVDIDFLSNIATNGWPVIFSKNFLKNSPHNVRASISPINENNSGRDDASKDKVPWEGAIVAVVGLYDKGKTFVTPTVENAKSKKYPIVRPLYYYYLTKDAKLVKPFIDYVLSAEGQKTVSTVGYISL